MTSLLPPFDFERMILAPWTTALDTYGWMTLMAFLVTATCGLIGNYLILRRMALVGDAISHSVLPGLAVAYLISGQLTLPAMIAGAVGAGLLTTFLIEFLHTRSRIKADAAIGITFCSLFAFGVVLINLFASKIHLDAECVLYGELSYLPSEPMVTILGHDLAPQPVLVMSCVAILVALLVIFFYKELLLTSFDALLAGSQGFRPGLVHLLLRGGLSVVIVAASGMNPPVNPFATATMSGTTPSCSHANSFPVLPNPVITSSAISSTPRAVHHSLSRLSIPHGHNLIPAAPMISGSITTPASLATSSSANASKSSIPPTRHASITCPRNRS